jgi:hypothetical protein
VSLKIKKSAFNMLTLYGLYERKILDKPVWRRWMANHSVTKESRHFDVTELFEAKSQEQMKTDSQCDPKSGV